MDYNLLSLHYKVVTKMVVSLLFFGVAVLSTKFLANPNDLGSLTSTEKNLRTKSNFKLLIINSKGFIPKIDYIVESK
jgi:hypothetical protein